MKGRKTGQTKAAIRELVALDARKAWVIAGILGVGEKAVRSHLRDMHRRGLIAYDGPRRLWYGGPRV